MIDFVVMQNCEAKEARSCRKTENLEKFDEIFHTSFSHEVKFHIVVTTLAAINLLREKSTKMPEESNCL